MRTIGWFLTALVLLVACSDGGTTPSAPPEATEAGLPNPASVYCEEQGGTLEIRENEEGQYGVCIFEDGSECDEWEFYRGECQPGDSLLEPTAEPQGAGDLTSEWLLFENGEYGFSFRYPQDWALAEDEREDSTSTYHLCWLRPNEQSNEVLTIGFRREDETDVGIQRTGVSSGDLVTEGTQLFLGQPLERVLLVADDKTMSVLYNGGAEIVRDDMRYTLCLDYAGLYSDPSALTEETQETVDFIGGSFKVSSGG